MTLLSPDDGFKYSTKETNDMSFGHYFNSKIKNGFKVHFSHWTLKSVNELEGYGDGRVTLFTPMININKYPKINNEGQNKKPSIKCVL